MPIFPRLRARNFDLYASFHAEAILSEDFPAAVGELETLISAIEVPVHELVRGGGGEALVTQRLRRALANRGWNKERFSVEKTINDRVTLSQSHEVDHAKRYENGTIALEIEWNNKDPFFDRDLENFNRLQGDGAISVGVIVTRGASLQDGLLQVFRHYAERHEVDGWDRLEELEISPTAKQRRAIARQLERPDRTFSDVWSANFVSNKFGTSTTHWSKLMARLERGVGSPCPLLAIGIPIDCISGRGDEPTG